MTSSNTTQNEAELLKDSLEQPQVLLRTFLLGLPN